MRGAVVLLWLGLATGAFAQSPPLIPLPVDQVTGRSFDSRDGQTLSGILVGFLIPTSGPITSVAPLLSELSGDGSLGKTTVAPWAGLSASKPLRVEKPGYAVAGLRVLVTVVGKTVRTRQFQVLWKPWLNGQLSGSIVESRVYGEAAGAKDATKVVELRLTSVSGALGIYGSVDDSTLAEFSLIQRAQPVLAANTDASPGPLAPQTKPMVTAPTVPTVDPVILKR